ncbi:MAG: c-type cytochrome [Planctomycetes bacterium]|nr:c-type cytochrome [Planctomycetota bacterium]
MRPPKAISRRVLSIGLIFLALALSACTQKAEPGKKPAAELIQVPKGLGPVPVPQDNPITAEKIELGKVLYFDTRLSKDGTVSCATCHDPEKAWAEDTPTSTGIDSQIGPINSPTVINTAYLEKLFWDGRAASLEEQAVGPMANPIEMGHTLEALVASLGEVAGYKPLFKAAFGDEKVTADRLAQAIASFERTVLSGDSPYDRYVVDKDETALSEAQKRGMDLFMNKAGCNTCHTPPLFTNQTFINAGIGMDRDPPDPGRKAVTGNDAHLGQYRVPPLRDVAKTAPYFHDGSVATLREAVDIMAAGGKENPNLHVMMKAVGQSNLTDQDKADLVEFLEALSGTYPIIAAPPMPK